MLQRTVLALSFLSWTVAGQDTPRPPCNPATHCPPLSIECFRCNVRVEEETCGLEVVSLGAPKFTEPGFCVETSTLDFTGKVFQQHVNERCATMLDPAHRQIPKEDRIPTWSYQKACKELEITCNDGFCASLHGLPHGCYSGYSEGDLGPCDIETDLSLNTLLQDLLYTPENQAACDDHGGIRYDYLRCTSVLRPDVAGSTCDTDSNPVDGGVCSDRIAPIALPTEGDYCNEECTEDKESVEVDSCCLPVDEEIPCESVIVYEPESVVPPPHADVEKDVISEATSIVLDLNLERGSQNCCCEIQCQCFGDPHCSSFFGDYEVSQQSSGDFVMYEEAGYRLAVQVDAPGGIITKAFLTTSDGSEYFLDARECIGVDAPGKGARVITGDGPSDFYYLNEKDAGGNYVHSGPAGFQRHESVGTTNEEWTIDPASAVFVDGTTTTTFRCMLFYQGLGPRSRRGWYSRLDVFVKKTTNSFKYTTTEDICCATNSEVKDHMMNNGATGFCVRDANDAGTFIPGALTDGEPIGSRRLRTESVIKPRETYEQAQRRVLNSAPTALSEICGQSQHEDPFQCVANGIDFGLISIQKEVEAEQANCRKYANHNDGQTFSIQNKIDNPCLDGVYFEVQKVSGGPWIPVYFFPVDGHYCDGNVIIDFLRTKVNGDNLNLKDWKMRIRSCAIPQECDPERCIPTLKMEAKATKFNMPCIDSEINSEYFEKALAHCKCLDEGVADCIEMCYKMGDCPATSCDETGAI